MLLRQAVVLAAVLIVVAVVTPILPGVAVEAGLLPVVPTGLEVLAEPLFAAVLVPVAAAAIVAEIVLEVELEPASAPVPAVLAETLIVAVLVRVAAVAVVAVTGLAVDLEPAVAVSLVPVALAEFELVAVPSAVQAGVVLVLAVAPVLAFVVVEYWRSEPSSVAAASQVAPL